MTTLTVPMAMIVIASKTDILLRWVRVDRRALNRQLAQLEMSPVRVVA